MLRQLGITGLRPGFDGRATASAPNAANYDPARANPYPDWPDVLTLKDGRKVTTAQMWWKERRPEIVEGFEREVYGRVPKDVPKVAWTVAETVETTVGGQPVVARRVIGHVDNSAHPAITVDIRMVVVVPVHAQGPVPVLVMFGWGNMPDEPEWRFPGFQEPRRPAVHRAAHRRRLGLRVAEHRQHPGRQRRLSHLGHHRAHQRGEAPHTRAVGIAARVGLGRGPGARLPGDACPRSTPGAWASRGSRATARPLSSPWPSSPVFAVVLVGSSGEGGAKPHRRNFGEAVENLTGSGAYHWMAGSFLKYAAEEASFGRRTANDIPVDAHELMALCAPRPTFVSYGIPEKGDAHWLDQQGSYMATVAAGPVFRLLGVPDLGVAEDYRVAQMPPVNTGLLDGALAWRQHDGGHEDRTNMSSFIAWANRLLQHTPPHGFPRTSLGLRADRNSHLAHQQLLAKARSGGIDLYFLGDSLTRRWGALDYPEFLAHWRKTFHGWNAGNFGWGGDRTENVLWRLENGELDGVNPKVIVLLGGTNKRRPGARRRGQGGRRHPGRPGDRRCLPEEGARSDDRPRRHLPRATTTPR